MTIYDLKNEERIELTKKIRGIIGNKDSWVHEGMDTSQRIKARFDYDKLFEKLSKVWLQYGDKALAMNYTDLGSRKKGITPNGKTWILDMNCGWTERSRHCGTLYIEGEGTIFTSGTIAKAFEYIFNN